MLNHLHIEWSGSVSDKIICCRSRLLFAYCFYNISDFFFYFSQLRYICDSIFSVFFSFVALLFGWNRKKLYTNRKSFVCFTWFFLLFDLNSWLFINYYYGFSCLVCFNVHSHSVYLSHIFWMHGTLCVSFDVFSHTWTI